MRYDDASNAGSTAADNAPVARPDVDSVAAGGFQPATGNAISGAGTVSGAAGADTVGDAPGKIVEVHGAGGATTMAGDSFQATGQYGVLSMSAQGDFNYVRNPGTPEGVEDVFGYTLADRDGGTSSTTLTINVGQTPAQAALALADGAVTLPAGVELSDIKVVGRDLVINMPDGSQMVIPGGAIFVPNLVIGDVEVPPANLAALLVDSEPQPAAGPLQSSGGNFDVPVPPLDPGVPLGDLIPPTDLSYTPPEFEDLGDFVDDEPEIVIIPDGQPAAVDAVDQVDESGLPERTDEPEGTLEPQNIESTSGVISIDAGDGIDGVTINGVAVTTVGQVIAGDRGNLTITSIDLDAGTIGYTYTVTDNTIEGVNDFDDFSVTVTDNDGDTATATLHIDILDDGPIARNDTDSVSADSEGTIGNVISGAGTTSGAAGADTEGADGIFGETNNAIDGLTGIRAGTTGAFTAVPQNGGGVVVHGQFGDLTIHVDGSYTYTKFEGLEESGNDVFTYQLTDGDGTTATATLTITVAGNPNDIPEILRAEDTLVDEDGLKGANVDAGRPGEVDSTEQATDTGSILVDYKGDVPANLLNAITLVDSPALDNELTTPDGTPILFALEGGKLVGRPDGTGDPVIIISITGATPGSGGQVTYTYQVELLGPVAQPDPGSEDSVILHNVGVQVTDSNGDHASSAVDVTIVDDLPIGREPEPDPEHPNDPPPPLVSGAVDEDDLIDGNSDVADGDDLADPSSTTVSGDPHSLDALFKAGADSPMKNFGLVDDPSKLPVLTSDGHAVLYSINTATGTLVAYADLDDDGFINDGAGSEVFTLQVNSDGSWSFTLQGNLDHPDVAPEGYDAYENNLQLDLGGIITAEDQDGDPATAESGAFVIDVDDDIPTAREPQPDPEHPNDPPPPLLYGRVDEDDLSEANGDNSNGNNDHLTGDDEPVDPRVGDADATTTGGAAGSLDALFKAGADNPLTYTLDGDTSALEAQNLTSNGHALLYVVDVEAGVLTAYADLDGSGILDNGEAAGSNVVFTLTVGEDGSWEFNLQDQIDHSEPGVEDNKLIDFGAMIIATDTDGDSVHGADGAFIVDVDDDMPKPFDDPNDPEDDVCPDDVIIVNSDDGHFHGDLNLPPVGADDPGKVTFGVSDGDPVLDSDGNPISAEGQALFYFINDAGVLEAREGGEGGTLVFTITLNDDGTYDYDQFVDISSTTTLNLTQFDAVGGGNVDAKAVDIPDSQFDLIVSTKAGDSVNTNNTTFGVSDGQSFKAGEDIRFDLIQNAFTTGSGGDAVVNYGEYYTANGFRQDVSGLAADQTANFTVRAIVAVSSGAEDGADGDGVFYGDANDTVVPVTALNLYDDAGLLVDPGDYAALGITVTDLGGGVWQVIGLPNNYDYEITSDTAFNAVQVQAIEDTGTFKLGAIEITATTQTDVDFSVPITFTDADGDPVTCDIDVSLGAPTNTPDVTAQVNEAGLDSIGSDGGSDSETTGGDLSSIVSGGSGTITFGLVGDGDNDGVIIGTHGTLTLDKDTGVWTYTLTDPVDGSTANNGTNVVPGVENFQYQMFDNGILIGTGDIKVNVVDDVPTALDDTDVITEGDANEQGNVITGTGTTNDPAGDDTLGADGATVTAASGFGGAGIVDVGTGNITVTGQWGTLVIEPNGHYTYTLTAEGAAALEAKGEGQTLADEVFNYTLTDGDGDQEGATLTITPTGTNDNPGLTVPDTGDDVKNVYEAGLAERSGEPAGTAEAADGNGTDNDVNSETVTGSFTFSDGDGATVLTINGTNIPLAGPFPLAPIAGTYGNLTVTSIVGHTVNYSYTLSDNIDHSDLTPDQDDFTITVDDSDGSAADKVTDTLTIHINDDAPIADNDTDVIDEGDTSETGNVITGAGTTSGLAGDDRVGADDAEVTAVSHPTGGAGIVDGVTGNITVSGLWGTLVIEPDGDYTYTLTPAGTTALNALGAGQTLTPEVFTYTLTDGDDSTDTATLTITPTGADDRPGLTVPDTGDDVKNVYEAGLAERSGEPAGTAEAADGNGTDNDVNSETVTGSFTFSDGDGATVLTINGTNIPLAGPFPLAPIAGTYGNLTVTSIVGHTVNYSYTLSDNINHNDANPDQDDFTITVDDSDGSNADKVTDTLTIHIIDDTPIADDDTDALTEGETSQTGNVITGAGTTSGLAGDDRVGADNASVTAATGFGGVGVKDGVTGNITVTGQWGTIVIEPDGDYTYTLSSAGIAALEAKGAGQTLTPEQVTYTLTDTDGSTDTATLTISLTGTDDTPTLTVPDTGPDLKTVDEAGLPARTGELAGTGEAANPAPNTDNSEIVSGTFSFTPGDGATVVTIDGAGAGGPLTIPLAGPFPTAAVVGTYGSIVITGVSGNTISYTYTLTDNVNHATQTPQDDFTITVDDSDGSTADKVTDTLTIHITDDTPLDYQPDTAIVENSGTDTFTGKLDDDDTLDNDGGADSIASLVWNTGANGTVLQDVNGHDVTVNGQQVKLYIQPDGSLKATTDNSNAAMTVFTATLDVATSGYTIDFDRPLDNGSSSASDFTGAKAGNNQWIGIDPDRVGGAAIDIAAANDPNPDSTDLLVTGLNHTTRAAVTVNRDSDDIGTGSGQANAPNESLRIDFVQDLRRDAGVDESTAGGYNFDNHVGQKVFTFTMVDPKAHGNTAVLLEAFNVTDETASKSNVSTALNNTPVEIDPASIVVKLGNTVLVAGVNYNVYDSGNGVYVSPIPEGATIQFQAMGGATFEAVEITNAAGHDIPGPTPGNFTGADFAIGGFSYGVNDPGQPVEFHLPTLLTDGDGDTSSGTVDVNVYPVGQEPAHALAAFSAETTFAKMLDSTQQKQSESNTLVMTAAIAAAGLATEPLAASTEEPDGKNHGGSQGSKATELSSITSDTDDGASSKTVEGDHKSLDASEQPVADSHHSNDDGGSSESSVSTAQEQVQAPAELLEGTDTPTHGDADAAPIVAPAIVMPTAEQLEGAKESATEGKSSSVDGSEGQMNTEAVAQVLADALNGGGSGPDLEALINTLPGKGHGGKGLDALASQGHGAVSNGDTADFAGFTGGHGMHTMDQMAVHQDAAPAHG